MGVVPIIFHHNVLYLPTVKSIVIIDKRAEREAAVCPRLILINMLMLASLTDFLGFSSSYTDDTGEK